METTRKTRKFLIATHGAFAKGIKSSLDIIIGPMENVYLIQAYIDENKTIETDLADIIGNAHEGDEWVIFSDLLGGSITNQVLQYTSGGNAHVVAGFNLPVLIEVLMADTDSPIGEVIEQAITNAKEQLVYVNKLINQKRSEVTND
jgi:fructoselysine and glucoselysine-specific PTS system IIA component